MWFGGSVSERYSRWWRGDLNEIDDVASSSNVVENAEKTSLSSIRNIFFPAKFFQCLRNPIPTTADAEFRQVVAPEFQLNFEKETCNSSFWHLFEPSKSCKYHVNLFTVTSDLENARNYLPQTIWPCSNKPLFLLFFLSICIKLQVLIKPSIILYKTSVLSMIRKPHPNLTSPTTKTRMRTTLGTCLGTCLSAYLQVVLSFVYTYRIRPKLTEGIVFGVANIWKAPVLGQNYVWGF